MSLRRGLLLCIFSLAVFAIALYFGSPPPPQSNALWRIVNYQCLASVLGAGQAVSWCLHIATGRCIIC